VFLIVVVDRNDSRKFVADFVRRRNPCGAVFVRRVIPSDATVRLHSRDAGSPWAGGGDGFPWSAGITDDDGRAGIGWHRGDDAPLLQDHFADGLLCVAAGLCIPLGLGPLRARSTHVGFPVSQQVQGDGANQGIRDRLPKALDFASGRRRQRRTIGPPPAEVAGWILTHADQFDRRTVGKFDAEFRARRLLGRQLTGGGRHGCVVSRPCQHARERTSHDQQPRFCAKHREKSSALKSGQLEYERWRTIGPPRDVRAAGRDRGAESRRAKLP
jgi:hypothetical protein